MQLFAGHVIGSSPMTDKRKASDATAYQFVRKMNTYVQPIGSQFCRLNSNGFSIIVLSNLLFIAIGTGRNVHVMET